MFCFRLTLHFVFALHLQVDGGQAQLVGLLRGQVFGRLVLLLYGVADTEAAPHGGHLSIKLLPSDLMVKAQPAELDLHPEGTVERDEMVKGDKERKIQRVEDSGRRGTRKRRGVNK